MFDKKNRKREKVQKELETKFKNWSYIKTGKNLAEYMGMNPVEVMEFHGSGTIPERFLK